MSNQFVTGDNNVKHVSREMGHASGKSFHVDNYYYHSMISHFVDIDGL